MFCRKCGKELNENTKFCDNCGEPVEQLATDKNIIKSQEMTINKPPKKKKGCGCLISIIISIIIFVGLIVFSIIFTKFQSDSIQKGISGVESKEDYITLDEFNKISSGMTYDEVVNIVGSAGTVSSDVSSGDYNIKIITWYGNGLAGSNANVTFTNGIVSGKAQVGLK